MPFTKILVALDHSEAAARAADIAKDLAHALHAELSLVFVADTESGLSGDTAIAPDDLAAALGQDAKRLLTKYSEHLGPVSNKFILFGAPGEEIVKTAREWPADLIVIGSYGGSVLRDALLGSVAEFVMRHGPCPVLVVRAKESGVRGIVGRGAADPRRRRRRACVVSDLKLSAMSGFDLLAALRARGGRPPFILITAHDAPGLREEAARRPTWRNRFPAQSYSTPSKR